jgi:predicted enzyme related to lactoylglutathione lyase
MANQVTWFEVIGKDGKKLRDFYAGIFGWKVDANNPMNYGMVDASESGIGGGIGEAQPGQQPSLTWYVTVPDLEATLKDVEARGGKTIAPPMAVPNGPTIAQFADPDGNVVGLIKA